VELFPGLILQGGLPGRLYYGLLDRYSGSYTQRILQESVDLLGQLWPYLVMGIVLTTLVKMYISKDRMAGFFTRRNASVSILFAALIGAASPLGSYVVIPLAAALFATGIPLAPLMALMVASPLINPNLFLLTMGAMGLQMALARTISAVLLGILAGIITQRLTCGSSHWSVSLLRPGTSSLMAFSGGPSERSLKSFLRELYRMTRYVSRYFFLAVILAAAIKILVNPSLIYRVFGNNEFMSVVLTTAAGVPFYVCGGAAIPVVQSLADMGMSGGAVLAFFISGPVTKISNLVILHAAFRSRLMLLYLAIGTGGAVLFGLLFNLLE